MEAEPGTGNAPEVVFCPGCCTLNDILACDYDPEGLAPLVRCARRPFTFPLLPGEFAATTLEAMHQHTCRGSDEPGNWAGVAQAITSCIREPGLSQEELTERSRQ